VREIHDAIVHLDAAVAALTLEAYKGRDFDRMERVEHFTIAEELKRVDSALGPKGESMFGAMAELILEAYVEILAAREALRHTGRESA
jgi:hypothetical protein